MKTIKLIQILHALCRGGSETLAKAITLGLDPAVFRTALCALDAGGALEEDLRSHAIPYFIMHRHPGFDKLLLWRLYRLFHRERVDIVQTHHLGQLVYSIVGARLAGARLIHVEHEYYSLQAPKSQQRLRILAPFCHKIVAVSDTVTEFLHTEVKIPKDKLITIYNGVDCERFTVDGNRMRSAFGFMPEDLLIGTIGRLEEVKDHFTLLDAFSIVQKTYPHAKLLLIGDGSFRAALERRTEELALHNHVLFLGIRTDIPEVLSLFDVFVLSSFQEGLPMAILEAMAAGKPIVATAVGSIPSIVQEGVTGVLVSPKSPDRLAEALIRVLSDRMAAAAMGKAGQALVESHYHLAETIKAYQKIYEAII